MNGVAVGFVIGLGVIGSITQPSLDDSRTRL
jgi:hypothetical protein